MAENCSVASGGVSAIRLGSPLSEALFPMDGALTQLTEGLFQTSSALGVFMEKMGLSFLGNARQTGLPLPGARVAGSGISNSNAALDPVKKMAADMGDSFKSSFKNIKLDIIDLEGSIKSSFKSIGNNILGTLSSTFNQGLQGILGKLFEGRVEGGLGGAFSSILSGLFGFAGGGRLHPGRPTLVGERGPELLVPDRSATIINNMDSRRVATGAVPQVNQSIKFDLVPGPTVEAMIQKQLPAIKQAATEAALSAIANRGY